MAEITTNQRKALPSDKFALPSKRAYPIHNAGHVRNAAARLEQEHKAGKISDADYGAAKKRIAAAAKRFGVNSKFNKPKTAQMDLMPSDVHVPSATPRRRLHVRADLAVGGSLHVRHMSDGSAVGCLPFVSLSSEIGPVVTGSDGATKNLVWTQIAEVGSWRGHSAGPFELTPHTFTQICTNFKRDGLPVPIDAEHASESPPTEGSIPSQGAPAMGWIHDLDNRGSNGLWGLVEWLEPARTYIKEGRYKFLSPAVRFNSRDRVTGENIGARLSSAAITNSPFLKSMKPLAASDHAAVVSEELVPMSRVASMRVLNHEDFVPKLKAALKMNELSSLRECGEQLGRLRDMYETAPHAKAMHQGVDLGAYTDSLSSLMGMPANASIGELLDAVQEMIDAAMERHEAEYHTQVEADDDDGGDDVGMSDDTSADDSAGMADLNTQETQAMSDTTTATLLTAAPLVLAAGQDTDARIKELESKLAERDIKIVALEASMTQLMSDKTTREDADRERYVDAAMSVHKLGASRDSLVAMHRANPSEFKKAFPVENGYLLTMYSTPGAGVSRGATTLADRPAPVDVSGLPGIEDLVAKFTKEGSSLDEACWKADAEIRRLTARAETLTV